MSTPRTDPRWRKFEKAIQLIFRKNPRATVMPDAEIVGRSGRKRKLEILVEYRFVVPFAEGFEASIPIRIAVDCKDYKDKVGIKKVEEFHGQMDDVGAPVGIMVSPKGFDDGAKGDGWKPPSEQIGIDLTANLNIPEERKYGQVSG
jgi:hypothetical protein